MYHPDSNLKKKLDYIDLICNHGSTIYTMLLHFMEIYAIVDT